MVDYRSVGVIVGVVELRVGVRRVRSRDQAVGVLGWSRVWCASSVSKARVCWRWRGQGRCERRRGRRSNG